MTTMQMNLAVGSDTVSTTRYHNEQERPTVVLKNAEAVHLIVDRLASAQLRQEAGELIIVIAQRGLHERR